MSVLIPWLIAIGTTTGSPAQEPSVDFSGIREFVHVVSILERDQVPSAQDWAHLFRTPGYAALTRSEFPESFFTDQFELVFMPSKSAELAEALASAQGWRERYLRHFVHVRDRWDEVLAYIDDPRPGRMMPEARRRALDYLPAAVPDHIPPVAFVIFGPDARGYVPVVVDVLNAIDRHHALLLLLGHEFHHYYRYAILRYNRDAVTPEDEHVLWVFDQLQAEGMANQVNRREAFQDREDFARRFPAFHEAYLASGDVIRQMDHLLARMETAPERWTELGLELRRSIPQSGHPTGFFMTNLVSERLGMDRLIEEVGNPFAFLRLYHAAARQRPDPEAPPFSDPALRVIHRLERRYVGSGH